MDAYNNQHTAKCCGPSLTYKKDIVLARGRGGGGVM